MNSPETDAAFRDMVANIDLDLSSTAEFDSAVKALLAHYFELLSTTPDADLADGKAVSERQGLLTDKINRFLSHSEEFTYDTEIAVGSGAIILTLDKSDDSVEASILDGTTQLQGRIGGLYIGGMPDESVLTDVEDRIESDDSYYEVCSNYYGLALVLDKPTLYSPEHEPESIPEEMTVCIPLSYSSTRLTKAH